jgi:hypothetical protein
MLENISLLHTDMETHEMCHWYAEECILFDTRIQNCLSQVLQYAMLNVVMY